MHGEGIPRSSRLTCLAITLFEANVVSIVGVLVVAHIGGLDELTPLWFAVWLGPFVWGVWRGWRCTFTADGDGVFIRNPWRSHRFPLSSIEGITTTRPMATLLVPCLAVSVRGRRRAVSIWVLPAFSRAGHRAAARAARDMESLIAVSSGRETAGPWCIAYTAFMK